MKKLVCVVLLLCACCVGCSSKGQVETNQVGTKVTFEEQKEYLEQNSNEIDEKIEETDLDTYKFLRESYLAQEEGQLKENYYNMLQTMWNKDYIYQYEKSLDDSLLD